MKKLFLSIWAILAFAISCGLLSCGDDGAYDFEKNYKNVIDKEAIGAAGLNKSNASGGDSAAVVALENTLEYWQQKYNKYVIEAQNVYNEYISLYRKAKLTQDQKMRMYVCKSTFNDMKTVLKYIRENAQKHGFYIEKASIENKSI
jgi:hypothetical protein